VPVPSQRQRAFASRARPLTVRSRAPIASCAVRSPVHTADRIEAAYGRTTLDRLAALKRKWDPDNFFRHTKGVTAHKYLCSRCLASGRVRLALGWGRGNRSAA